MGRAYETNEVHEYVADMMRQMGVLLDKTGHPLAGQVRLLANQMGNPKVKFLSEAAKSKGQGQL